MTKSTVSNIGIAGVALFVITAISGAMLIPGYSQVSQFLSESYAIDTKHGLYLRLLGYIPSGLLILVFCFRSVKYLSQTKATVALRGIGLFYGGGTLLTAIFPCDAGCNKEMIEPSVAQLLHSFSGLFTYVTVPIFVIMLGFAATNPRNKMINSKIILLCGLVSLVFAVVFFSQLSSPYGGVYQRVLEGSILLAVLLTALHLKKI